MHRQQELFDDERNFGEERQLYPIQVSGEFHSELGQSGSELFDKLIQGEPRLLSHELDGKDQLDREFLTGERGTGSILNEAGTNSMSYGRSMWKKRKGEVSQKKYSQLD